jgi:hypothetical protein
MENLLQTVQPYLTVLNSVMTVTGLGLIITLAHLIRQPGITEEDRASRGSA